MVLSITFYPVYRMFAKLIRRPWAASLITLLIILIIIVGPFTYILSALINEITDTYRTVEDRGFEVITRIQEHPAFSKLLEKTSTYTAGKGIDLNEAAIRSLKAVGKYIGEHISQLFKNVIVFAMSFVIMCLTIFFFLKDGDALINYIKGRLPFVEEQKKLVEKRVKEMVIAAIYGGLAVGIVQGTLGGLAFLVLGLSAPVFWGLTMAIFSLVPVFGAFAIWGPASAILILSGSYAKGIGLFLFGVFVISTVDNILKPLIIGGRTKLHTLLIFFSVLGGIKLFGFIGFILGPLISVLCLSLLEIYTIKPNEK
jgi:predicted PurR-regulated permease PerM